MIVYHISSVYIWKLSYQNLFKIWYTLLKIHYMGRTWTIHLVIPGFFNIYGLCTKNQLPCAGQTGKNKKTLITSTPFEVMCIFLQCLVDNIMYSIELEW